MAKKRRLYKSWLGIPLWLITGLCLFILFSAVYDWVVRDVSVIRYGLIIATSFILLISIGLKFVSLSFIEKQARRQMGA